MKNRLTPKKANLLIEQYFYSRRIIKRDKSGEVIFSKEGDFLYDEKPYTITGLALALGFSEREELFSIQNEKVKALVNRALLRIEESAEEKLFNKDTFSGTKLFLATNFERWNENAALCGENETELGAFSAWAK